MFYYIKSRLPLLWALLAIMAFAGCMDDASSPAADPFADCRYGAPKPIFSEGLRSVTQHGFHLEESRAVETVSFDDGLKLSILQSGCDYIHQEFQFHLIEQFAGAPSSYWIQETINRFNQLGQLGPAYVIYVSVADALSERSNQIVLGESTELQPGFFAKIENGNYRNGGALVVTLSEQPSGSVASSE